MYLTAKHHVILPDTIIYKAFLPFYTYILDAHEPVLEQTVTIQRKWSKLIAKIKTIFRYRNISKFRPVAHKSKNGLIHTKRKKIFIRVTYVQNAHNTNI